MCGDASGREDGNGSLMEQGARPPAAGGGDAWGVAESARAACAVAWTDTAAWADATNRGASSGYTPDELRAMSGPGVHAMQEADAKAVVQRAVAAADKWVIAADWARKAAERLRASAERSGMGAGP